MYTVTIPVLMTKDPGWIAIDVLLFHL